jgi:hypothetical protein
VHPKSAGPHNTESVDDYLKAILELGGAEEELVAGTATFCEV